MTTHLYDVQGPSLPALPVFATSFNEAAEIAITWWLVRHMNPVPDIEVKRRNPSWPGLNADHLIDALDTGLIGIGYYEPTGGWVIRGPGHIASDEAG